MITRRRLIAASSAGVAAALLPGFARAQIVDKQVRIVVGFPAGGPTDAVARILADRLRGKYAATIIVDNRPGAAGRIGIDNVKASPPDGSAILITPASMMTIYPHVYKKLSYDVLKDFVPVTPVGSTAFALSVGPMVPASVKSVADFVKWCKDNPKQAIFASPAAGSMVHFAGALFSKAADAKMEHVAYKGSAPAMQELLGGQIPSTFTVMYDAMQHVKAGKIRVLATSGAKRSRFLPDVPTFVESGLKDVEAIEWFGIFLPAKTPPEIANKLAEAIKGVVETPQFREQLEQFAFEPLVQAPAQFVAMIKSDLERWGPVVKATGFQLDE
jgi:tripartite-type tricarboxylate transporter receptor subunit TctC